MKRSILIVDDMEVNRELLSEAFRGKYDIIEARNGKEALKYIEDTSRDIAAVLLDMFMPEVDGMTVLRRMNETGAIERTPVFIITAENNETMLVEAYKLGAVDVIIKPFMMTFVKCRIENAIELFTTRNGLEKVVNEQVRKLSRFNQSMVEALATLVEFRECESDGHIKRMCGLTEILMSKVSSMYPEYRLPKEEIDKIVSASVLHDVGKIAIPDNILNKPGKLTNEEFEIMKKHAAKGCEILRKMPHILEDGVYNYAIDIARHHHERWDGSGYPDRLAGDKITIWSQVVSVVDVYDALVSQRVYKKAYDHNTAAKMIMDGECGAFNPKVLKAFELSLMKIHQKHAELTIKDRAKAYESARLLIVDDSEIDRTILRNILEPDFQIIEAVNGYEALKILGDTNLPKIDGVLLDISMPILDGFNVLKLIRDSGSQIPIVLMTSEATRENVEKGMKYNILGFISKPFDPQTVTSKLRTVYHIPETEEEEEKVSEKKQNAISELDVSASMTYCSQLKNVYSSYLKNANRDSEPYQRVSDILAIVLEEYSYQNKKLELDRDHIMLISNAAYFYDIGLMGIPDEIVNNHNTISDGLIIYEDHARIGAFIVRLNKDKACSFFVDTCAEICMHHHERNDGRGYPHKLSGNEITYYTNMTRLCIEFDRLFFRRSEYNDLQFEFVMKELDVDRGRFDYDLVDLFKSCHVEITNYYRHMKEGLK
ncbi:MAG: response regulator [Oscillospiraceae bacterium]|nr:response regulator [Oscillospiraceae bacterium]